MDKMKLPFRNYSNHIADYELVSRMRASFCVLGPLIGKLKSKSIFTGWVALSVLGRLIYIKRISGISVDLGVQAGYVEANVLSYVVIICNLGGDFVFIRCLLRAI